jgi:DNA helicase-2/ATP-dependent DNA helicase PcrA
MSKPLLSDLNPQQREAILHTGGPLLILAGAGSGKTRVITCKFAHLAKKLHPNSILTVTFTNKAADEMKERISGFLKNGLSYAWIGTFHSQCNKILRKEIGALGYGGDFTIYDDDDQASLIRHILKDFKLYEALYKGVQAQISSLKTSLTTPEEFLARCDGFGFEERLARVYVRYQDELKRSNALDFDDLIMLTIRLFMENPKILKKYNDAFGHILVDEFQDTNHAQYVLLKLLSSAHKNICVVGDDDQSIYRFRGADVNNILNFEKDFPGAKVIKLEKNYRSTENILKVSTGIIKKNAKRYDKLLLTNKDEGEKVYYCWLSNEEDEAKHLAKVMRELYLRGVCDFKDFAVLYRVNSQSRVLEETFNSERIPYKILGSVGFYQRKEIKDLIAYIRLFINPDDNVSLRRVINCPPRGIGASTLSRIEQHAKKKSASLFAAMNDLIQSEGLTASMKEKLELFKNALLSITSIKYKDAAELIMGIIDRIGYMDFINEDRADNITEMISSAEGKDIREFVDRLSLFTNLDSTNTENAVSLLTLHSAKGLEFPVVFITGLEEGLLPYFKAKSPDEIAEERRLLYVGMTRAKDILWLTGAGKRRLYTKIQEQEPSRFIKDIPHECCQRIEKSIKTHIVASAAFAKPMISKKLTPYMVGSRVKHPRWGVGVIRDCDGEGEEQKVTVNFPNVGIKKLALRFANLVTI